MAKVLKTIAVVAAVVAVAATGYGLIAGAGAMIAGVSVGTIAAVASAVSAVASMGAGYLTKPPDMKGSVNQVLIGNNLPVMYCMGRSYSGGGLIYENSNGTDNRDRTQIMAHTVAGPIEEFQSFLGDYTGVGIPASGGLVTGAATGWYNDFLWVGSRKGLKPETALTAPAGRAAFRDWTAASALSGIAATAVTMKFDKEGKRYSGGIPQWGVVAKWVKVYDPRLDGTYPGGLGTQRWADESTWAWSENPALHALAYVRGRFVNELKIVGAGIAKDAINIPRFVELANICDANGWTIGGTIYEGPGLSKWENLKRILVTAAAEPVWVGGTLDLKITTPKVALATITTDDILGDIEVAAMTGFKDRINTIVPRVRSEAHRWEYKQGDPVSSTTYVTEDGEVKTEEFQFDLCQDKDQATELAAYMLANRREFRPITIICKPWLKNFKPGECLNLNIAEAGLNNQLVTILSREVDPATGSVTFTMESETSAKHAWALGRIGALPPTPSLWTPEQVDNIAGQPSSADLTLLIANSGVRNLDLSIDTAGLVLVSAHERVYADKVVALAAGSVAAPGAVVAGDAVGIFYDDPGRLGAGSGQPYQSAIIPGGVGEMDFMFPSSVHPNRHFISLMIVPATGTAAGGSGIGPDTGGTGGGVGGVNAYPIR